MSFTLQEPKIVVGSLTFDIPTNEKSEFAVALKEMAEVADEHGLSSLKKALVNAAKKLSGRKKPGPKPGSKKKKAAAKKPATEEAKPKTRISIKAQASDEEVEVVEETVDTVSEAEEEVENELDPSAIMAGAGDSSDEFEEYN